MTDILESILAEFEAQKTTGAATPKHQAIVEKLTAAILERHNRFKLVENPQRIERGEEPYSLHEIKSLEVTSYGKPRTYVIIETGLVGDEGTLAQVIGRDYRHITIAKNGGLTLLNAKRKRESLGFFWAVHGLTK